MRHTEDASAIPLEADSLLRIATLAEEFGIVPIRDDTRYAAERIAESTAPDDELSGH